MRLIKHIPNFLTSLNLFTGTLAVVFAFEGQFHWAALLVGIAALFDFLDGMTARLLKAWSAMGKELDSLADLVSFGLAPAVILFRLMQQSNGLPLVAINSINVLPFTAFIITVFSALRLAKFNIDTRQSDSFLGLPTPANAIFIVSIPLALHYGEGFFYPLFAALTQSFGALAIMVAILSFLMIAEIPLFSLKFKSFRFAENKTRFVFLLISLAMIIMFHWYAIALTIILYLLLSVADNLARGRRIEK